MTITCDKCSKRFEQADQTYYDSGYCNKCYEIEYAPEPRQLTKG